MHSSEPATDEIPVVVSKKGLFARIADDLSDPVLRALVSATAVSRIGRGVFLAVTVLFFTQIIGLSGGEAAVVLAASSGCGVVASFLGGWLADRWSARRMTFGFEVLAGLMLAAYAFAGDFVSALVLASLSGFFDSMAYSARAAIIARGFASERRVHARAVLRTVTNVSIAIGSGFAAIALALGTAEAYRVVIAAAGLLCAFGSLPLLRLTAAVDAPSRARIAPLLTETGSIDVEAATSVASERSDWRRRSPWRDRRYLLMCILSAIFGMQFGVAELGVPLWITQSTTAPEVLVSVILIVNTTLVVIFQVPASRGTHDLRVAGRVTLIAGWLMLVACVVYALAAGLPTWFAIAVILAAAIAHTFAEILSQAGAWGLSFELADPVRAGAYQGVFGMGFSLGALAAPIVVNATAISLGLVGWVILGGVFLAAAAGIWLIARRAAAASVVASTTP
ncbi:MFS transporter [Microbacterium aurantiacum]|uniref:MFS transporter n=1 Tax=Microbacterium aurantiacum TaxID=162393 RepID=UPI001FE7524A|nr:MFS transporter [Microbacterium aurantiacum]